MVRPPPASTLFLYTTLFRSCGRAEAKVMLAQGRGGVIINVSSGETTRPSPFMSAYGARSEEHTSELQSHVNLVYRLLLEKKNKSKSTVTVAVSGADVTLHCA